MPVYRYGCRCLEVCVALSNLPSGNRFLVPQRRPALATSRHPSVAHASQIHKNPTPGGWQSHAKNARRPHYSQSTRYPLEVQIPTHIEVPERSHCYHLGRGACYGLACRSFFVFTLSGVHTDGCGACSRAHLFWWASVVRLGTVGRHEDRQTPMYMHAFP